MLKTDIIIPNGITFDQIQAIFAEYPHIHKHTNLQKISDNQSVVTITTDDQMKPEMFIDLGMHLERLFYDISYQNYLEKQFTHQNKL